MKELKIFIFCLSLLLVLTGCNSAKEINILNFKAEDVEDVEVYKFNIPTEASGMIVTEDKDIKRIIEAFSEIIIEGDATDINLIGGDVISFRFNLKNGEEFTIAHWEGILMNLDTINYKVSGDSIVNLWNDLDYQKNDISESKLPIVYD